MQRAADRCAKTVEALASDRMLVARRCGAAAAAARNVSAAATTAAAAFYANAAGTSRGAHRGDIANNSRRANGREKRAGCQLKIFGVRVDAQREIGHKLERLNVRVAYNREKKKLLFILKMFDRHLGQLTGHKRLC